MDKNTNMVSVNEGFVDVTNENGMKLSVRDFAQPSGKDLYSSFVPAAFDGKMKLFNAINNPDESVIDFVGKDIVLKDIVAHPVVLEDEETGEEVNALRTIIIDNEGKTYGAVSLGFSSALQRLLEQFGQPSEWENPIIIEILTEKTRKGNNKVTTFCIKGEHKSKSKK